MTIRPYFEPTEPVGGYALDGWWAVAEPPTEDITNLATNPSFEVDTTDWTAIGGSIARVITYQRRGAYSLEVTPSAGQNSDGAYYARSLTTNIGYGTSFDFLGAAGVAYQAFWADTSNSRLSRKVTFRGTGRWQRIHFGYHETSTATRRLTIAKDDNTSVAPFYVDGVLIIAGSTFDEYLYFDGDSEGLTPLKSDFYWIGTPHGSTSVMKAYTRAGGVIRPLVELGLTLLAFIGTGLPDPQNVVIPSALTGGEFYQRTLPVARSFDLLATMTADNLADLQRKHRDLERIFNVRRQPTSEPLTLLYQPQDECGEPKGEMLQIICSLEGGLSGGRNNHHQEQLALRFRVHLPYIAKSVGTDGAALDVRDSFAAAYAAYKNKDGAWMAPGLLGGASATVRAAAFMPDGRILVGGDFTSIFAVAGTAYLAIYDPETDAWSSASATTLDGAVRAILPLPDGRFLIGGDWTAITPTGGGTAASWIFIYNPATSAYQRATTIEEFNALIRAFALLPDGTVAVGGDFTDVGDANGDYLARLNYVAGTVSAFVSSNPLNALVRTLTIGPLGYLWFGGDFTDIGGVADADYLGGMGPPYSSYTLCSYSPRPLSARVNVLYSLANGNVLVGGNYTDVGSVASWDYLAVGRVFPAATSTAVLQLSQVAANLDAEVLAVTEPFPNNSLIGGSFTQVGEWPAALFDGLVSLMGNAPQPIDVDFAGSVAVNALASNPKTGEIFLGTNVGGGTSYTSGTTTITNTGTADAFPVITITYASAATALARLYSIRNLDTGQVLSFDLYLLPGETLTLDLRRGQKAFTGSVRGSLVGRILPGSDLTTFRLIPGTNRINIFIDIASAANASSHIYWQPTYISLDGAVE